MKELRKKLKKSQRLRYPVEEVEHVWLPILLDAYHIADVGISIELRQEEKKRNAKVACYPGCSNCCSRPTVPITPLELLGILWFVCEKLEGDVRAVVKRQLLHHRQTTQCPFLVDSLCSIYPVRPLACREFFVFGAPCQPREDVSLTRPNDMWTHSRDIGCRVAMTMLPFYGITGKRKKIEAFENGYIFSISKVMHELPWETLCDQMEQFDQASKLFGINQWLHST